MRDHVVEPPGRRCELLDRARLEGHVSIGAARTVFPQARIKKGPPDRFFRIEVIAGNKITELVVQDVTPRPQPKEDLSDEERWRRAGRRPDGKPLDVTELH